jgi:hypothetical protein
MNSRPRSCRKPASSGLTSHSTRRSRLTAAASAPSPTSPWRRPSFCRRRMRPQMPTAQRSRRLRRWRFRPGRSAPRHSEAAPGGWRNKGDSGPHLGPPFTAPSRLAHDPLANKADRNNPAAPGRLRHDSNKRDFAPLGIGRWRWISCLTCDHWPSVRGDARCQRYRDHHRHDDRPVRGHRS